METKIIKKNGKYYLQVIKEEEISLDELKERLTELQKEKEETLLNITEDYDERIAKLQTDITEIENVKPWPFIALRSVPFGRADASGPSGTRRSVRPNCPCPRPSPWVCGQFVFCPAWARLTTWTCPA